MINIIDALTVIFILPFLFTACIIGVLSKILMLISGAIFDFVECCTDVVEEIKNNY
jgi:hypothetical protein